MPMSPGEVGHDETRSSSVGRERNNNEASEGTGRTPHLHGQDGKPMGGMETPTKNRKQTVRSVVTEIRSVFRRPRKPRREEGDETMTGYCVGGALCATIDGYHRVVSFPTPRHLSEDIAI